MNMKKPILRILQIWTLFVFTSISFLWMVSFSQPEISSFWNISSINVEFSKTVFAEEKCETITETVYDTVTSPSWTTSKVPRTVSKKVCSDGTTSSTNTTKSSKSSGSSSVNECTTRLYCAVNPKDSIQTSSGTTNSGILMPIPPVLEIITQTGTSIEGEVKNIDIVIPHIILPVESTQSIKKTVFKKASFEKNIDSILSWLTQEKQIIKLTSIQDSVADMIDSLSLKILTSTDIEKISEYEEKLSRYIEMEEIIKSQLKKYQPAQTKAETKTYAFKALNVKTYTIIDDGKIVSIKKADGSFAKQTFKTYSEAVAYLNVNAVNQPKVTVAKTVATKKTVASTPTTTKTTVAKTVVTTPKITTAVVTKPVVTTPKVTTPVVTTPKVDTTTKAS